jgi:hypothetical protein
VTVAVVPGTGLGLEDRREHYEQQQKPDLKQ